MDFSRVTKNISQDFDPKRSSKMVDDRVSSDSAFCFDSASDVGYSTGDIDSRKITTMHSQDLSSVRHHSSGKEHSVRFDSGLGYEVFSPMNSENDICIDRDTDPKSRENTTVDDTHNKDFSLMWQDIYHRDKDGDTILHLAVVEARSDVIFPLIRHAPHPDFLDFCNDLCQTPLHLSTLMGKSNIVRRLVAAGATLDIQDHHGNTALHIAARNGDLDCVRAILEPLNPDEIQECQSLYDLYLEDNSLSYLINMKNYNGQTSIHLASMGGFRKVLECLYEQGADVNDKEGKSGKTALHYAVENTNLQLVNILVSKCFANINVKNYAGHTPIQMAWMLYQSIASNRQQIQFAIFDFLKKNSTERWEVPSDSESYSEDEGESSEEATRNRSPSSSCRK